MIPDDVVERVRGEADIVSIIGEFVKLKRVGKDFRGPCPFHHGKNDNFTVFPGGGYKCFVCGEAGDAFTFVQKHLGLDFVEAVKWVGARSGVEVHEVARRTAEIDPREPLWEVNATAAAFFRAQLWESAGAAAAREYLASRSLTRADAERFDLGYAPRELESMRAALSTLGFGDERQLAAGLLVVREDRPEPRPRFRQRLIFPIADTASHIVGFGGRVLGDGEPKYLNSAESEVFAKRTLLYGMHWAKQSIRKADRVIVVEGYFDAIRLVLAGISEVVAPLGTALTEQQVALLRKYTKNVFLLYDSDQAGLKATFRAGDMLLASGAAVRVITLPEGDDPDTFVARVGGEGFERAAGQSLDVFDRKIQILERGGWFGDLRRKREAIDRLLPTIRVTADPITRDLYIARTSEAAGVSREELERELRAGPRRRQSAVPMAETGAPPEAGAERSRRAERRRDHSVRGNRAERELVRMLLHERRYIPSAAAQVEPRLFTDTAYRAIFVELTTHGMQATIDELAATLDEGAIEVLEELLGEQGGLDHAEEVARASVNALLARSLSARLTEIDRLLPLADSGVKDELIREKRQLAVDIKALGHSRWKQFNSASS
ncbi:MAG: DNA primase [Gemmatimonadales bacterium]